MLKNKLHWVVLFSSLLVTSHASALMTSNPTLLAGYGKTYVGLSFISSEIEYEIRGRSADIERQAFGLEVNYGIAPTMSFMFQLGMINDSELENLPDGDGYSVGLGVNGLVMSNPNFKIMSYSFFSYTKEEIDSTPKLKIDTQELHLGILGVIPVSPIVNPYIGIDIVPYSDGKIKGGTGSTKIKRDNMFNIKLGANIDIGRLQVRPELILVGETTVVVAVGSTF